MDDFSGSYSENKKNKEISADSQQKTIENVKITIEYPSKMGQFSFITYILMGKGK